MAKSLYNKDERHTPEANNLDSKTHNAVKGIFEEYVNAGYSVREISQIMQRTILDLELSTLM